MCGGKEEDEVPMDGEEDQKFCSTPARAFLFLFNFIIWVGCCLLLAMGIYGFVDSSYAQNVLDGNAIILGSIILIIVGGVGFIVAFIGCCGSIMRNKCLVMTYVIVLILLLTVILIGGIVGFVFTSKIQNASVDAMRRTLSNYRRNNDQSQINKSWDAMQRTLKCCGVTEYQDWEKYNQEFSRSTKFPESCCFVNDLGETSRPGCAAGVNPSDFYSEFGCHEKIMRILDEKSPYVAAVSAIVALCMIIGVVFGICVFNRM